MKVWKKNMVAAAVLVTVCAAARRRGTEVNTNSEAFGKAVATDEASSSARKSSTSSLLSRLRLYISLLVGRSASGRYLKTLICLCM